jgi:hypothetical protein
MSISSPQPGGPRQPFVRKAIAGAGAKPGADAKPSGAPVQPRAGFAKASPGAKEGSGVKGTGAKAPARQQGTGGGRGPGRSGGRTPAAPEPRERRSNWASVALFTAVFVLAAGIIAFGAYKVHENGLGWQARADRISGIVDYRKKNPTILTRSQKYGTLKYTVSPPVGGDYTPNWQRCQGDVYTTPIPNENAVDSLAHGAVWITYRPDLSAAQVAKLKAKVEGNEYLLMSPYPGLDSPISLQAWGFQLKVKNADDSRIADFIKHLKQNAAIDSSTSCNTGTYVTGTGSTPFDLGSPSATPSAGPSAGAASASSSAASSPTAPTSTNPSS